MSSFDSRLPAGCERTVHMIGWRFIGGRQAITSKSFRGGTTHLTSHTGPGIASRSQSGENTSANGCITPVCCRKIVSPHGLDSHWYSSRLFGGGAVMSRFLSTGGYWRTGTEPLPNGNGQTPPTKPVSC